MTKEQEQLVLDNTRLIHKCIKDLHIKYKSKEDYQNYYDSGLEGLIRGAKTYNGTTSQGTYLYKCIRNMICRYIFLSEMDKRKINKIINVSLDQYINYDNGMTLGDIVPSNYDIEEEAEKHLKIDVILEVLDNIENKKDTLIFKMYYGLDGFIPMTYEEISHIFGVTKGAIRMRLVRTVEKIKNNKLIKKELYET